MSDQQVLRVLVTRATNSTASSLIPKIASGKVYGENQSLILHLFDTPGRMQKLNEIQLEVNRYPLVLRCYVYNDEALAFSGIDAAILLANAEEVTNERFKLYGKAAQKWAKPACKVLGIGKSEDVIEFGIEARSRITIDNIIMLDPNLDVKRVATTDADEACKQLKYQWNGTNGKVVFMRIFIGNESWTGLGADNRKIAKSYGAQDNDFFSLPVIVNDQQRVIVVDVGEKNLTLAIRDPLYRSVRERPDWVNRQVKLDKEIEDIINQGNHEYFKTYIQKARTTGDLARHQTALYLLAEAYWMISFAETRQFRSLKVFYRTAGKGDFCRFFFDEARPDNSIASFKEMKKMHTKLQGILASNRNEFD